MSNLAADTVPDFNRVVAANVRAEMAGAGMRQSALAHELRVSEMWLSRRLSGKTGFDANDIKLFADYFGVEPGTLFTERRRPRGGAGAGDIRTLYALDQAPVTSSNRAPENPGQIVDLFTRREVVGSAAR